MVPVAGEYPPSVEGLRLSARWAYRELRRSPGGQLTKAELTRIMSCDRSTINRAVNDLESVGAVSTAPVPGDPGSSAVRLR